MSAVTNGLNILFVVFLTGQRIAFALEALVVYSFTFVLFSSLHAYNRSNRTNCRRRRFAATVSDDSMWFKQPLRAAICAWCARLHRTRESLSQWNFIRRNVV